MKKTNLQLTIRLITLHLIFEVLPATRQMMPASLQRLLTQDSADQSQRSPLRLQTQRMLLHRATASAAKSLAKSMLQVMQMLPHSSTRLFHFVKQLMLLSAKIRHSARLHSGITISLSEAKTPLSLLF